MTNKWKHEGGYDARVARTEDEFLLTPPFLLCTACIIQNEILKCLSLVIIEHTNSECYWGKLQDFCLITVCWS